MRTVRAVDTPKRGDKPTKRIGGRTPKALPPAPAEVDAETPIPKKAKAGAESLPGMDEHAQKIKDGHRKKAQAAAMEGPLRIHVSKTIATERKETGSVMVTAHAEVVGEQEAFRFLEAAGMRRKVVKLSVKAFSTLARVKEVTTGGEGGDEGESWTKLTLVGPSNLDGVCGRTVSIETAEETDADGF